MISLPTYLQPTPIKRRVMSTKKLLAFLDKKADEHRRKFRIQNWAVVHLPAPYKGIKELDYCSNLAVTQDVMTFMSEQLGVKIVIKVFGINWCIIY